MIKEEILYLKYPKPQITIAHNQELLEEDDDNELDVDLGFVEGVFAEGRPYKLHFWSLGDLLMVTICFSSKDMEDVTKQQLIEYLKTNILLEPPYKLCMQCKKGVDNADCKIWLINLVLQEAETIFTHIRGEEQINKLLVDK